MFWPHDLDIAILDATLSRFIPPLQLDYVGIRKKFEEVLEKGIVTTWSV